MKINYKKSGDYIMFKYDPKYKDVLSGEYDRIQEIANAHDTDYAYVIRDLLMIAYEDY